MSNIKKIKIKEIKDYLADGKKIKIKSKDNIFLPVSKYIEKGILDTYEVILDNDFKIKVSKTHLFFTNIGWCTTENLIPNKTMIFCDDGDYHIVKSVNYIGKYNIVDVSVEHEDYNKQAYFGNGMLNHNTGKTLACASLLAITQQKGGFPVLIDSESSISVEFMQALGIKTSGENKIIYVQLDTVEDAFATVDNIIRAVRENTDKDKIVTIVLDSLAGLSTKVEMEDDFDQAGFATQKAIIISKAMRKLTNMIAREKILFVFTNQLRTKLGCVNPLTTTVTIRKKMD